MAEVPRFTTVPENAQTNPVRTSPIQAILTNVQARTQATLYLGRAPFHGLARGALMPCINTLGTRILSGGARFRHVSRTEDRAKVLRHRFSPSTADYRKRDGKKGCLAPTAQYSNSSPSQICTMGKGGVHYSPALPQSAREPQKDAGNCMLVL